jgi:hypothetical protein
MLKDIECTRTGVFIGIIGDDFKLAVYENPQQITGYATTGT